LAFNKNHVCEEILASEPQPFGLTGGLTTSGTFLVILC